jgi:hypothetical protein
MEGNAMNRQRKRNRCLDSRAEQDRQQLKAAISRANQQPGADEKPTQPKTKTMITKDFDAPSTLHVDEFICENQRQFADFVSKRKHRAHLAERHRYYNERLADETGKVESLRQQLDFITGASIPTSIFNGISNQPGGASHIVQVAADFAGVAVLQTHGPAILKMATANLAKLEAEFARFQQENQSILKELGLI